jgi:hypothetical protein
MASFIRKNLSLSQENLSALRGWTEFYGVSESEVVRRAIKACDPEKKPIADMHESDVAAFFDHLREHLRSARRVVD